MSATELETKLIALSLLAVSTGSLSTMWLLVLPVSLENHIYEMPLLCNQGFFLIHLCIISLDLLYVIYSDGYTKESSLYKLLTHGETSCNDAK